MRPWRGRDKAVARLRPDYGSMAKRVFKLETAIKPPGKLTPSQAWRAHQVSVWPSTFSAKAELDAFVVNLDRHLSVHVYAYKHQEAFLWIVWRPRKDEFASDVVDCGKVTGNRFGAVVQFAVSRLIIAAQRQRIDEAYAHGKILKNEGKARGGRARAKALSPERRRAIARRAAEARWGKKSGASATR